jgi:ubiquinone/menaquinone biosynthesis C-methylase UbiE
MDAKHQYLTNLRKPLIQSIVDTLPFSPGSRGLDVGCGIGSHTLKLSNFVQPGGHVTGMDISPLQLTQAKDAAEESGLSQQVSFRQGDMRKLPFEDDSFDWVWSMDCVGYAPIEPLPIIQELARVVKPGGSIAIAAWSSERLMPGHPGLEARLQATSTGIAPFVSGKNPQEHFSRALNWFQAAGLIHCSAETFVGSAHAPLSEDMRAELEALFDMRWPGIQSELDSDDWDEFQRLCLPDTPDFILNQSDYYAFYTYSLFQGKIAFK